ncbi:MAG TPA: response regulator transcription factor [Bacteroidota bacterium]
MATRIFIVDDHEFLREGLKTVLEQNGGMKVCGEAGSFREFMSMFREHETDVVVLDISLPDRNGLDVLRYLKDHHPGVRVLILSMHPEERFALRTLKAGASGYVNKQSAARELVKAIQTVRRGGTYVSPQVTSQILDDLGKKKEGRRNPHEDLADREYEIFQLIAEGRTRADIAKKLGISVTTVMTYRGRILRKMKMKTTADLVRYAIEHRVID